MATVDDPENAPWTEGSRRGPGERGSLIPPPRRVRPAHRPERMEARDVSPGAMRRALDAVAAVSRRSGGYHAVWRSVSRRLSPPGTASAGRRIRVMDVGAGSGHLAAMLHRRLRARGLRPELWLADVHPVALRLSRATLRRELGGREADRARYVRLTAAALPLSDAALDFLVCATTLHHLEREEAVRFLREAERVTRRGWVVMDLRRSWATYLAIQGLARTLWRANPLPRVDGPLSVRRSFTAGEARGLLADAGLTTARVRARPPLRLCIEGGKG